MGDRPPEPSPERGPERGPARPAAWPARWWLAGADRTARAADRFDALQQRWPVTAVPAAVLRKYSDDRAGRLSGQIAYSAFLSVFPLLLVVVTVLGFVLHGHQSLQDDLINSALRQFPVVGSDLKTNVRALSGGSDLALAIGLVWLAYGSMKLSRAAQQMMATVWGIARDELPTFGAWLPRAAGFLAVLGAGFVAGGAAAGLGAAGRLGSASAVVGLLLSLVVNVLMFWGGFAVIVHIPHADRQVWPGAVVAGVAWTLLQFAGVQLVSHQLRHLSNLYGTFATVLGLMGWLALGSTLTVYAAEINVVLSRHLWPRSLRRAVHPSVPVPAAATTVSGA